MSELYQKSYSDRQFAERTLLEILDRAQEINLDLSLNEETYDLAYISKKLAACSHYIEALSAMAMQVTQVSLAINKRAWVLRQQARVSNLTLKESEDYKAQPRDQKTAWLTKQMDELANEAGEWSQLTHAAKEVHEAVGGRAVNMKRLDSDLRSHINLYEARMKAAGPVPPIGNVPSANTGEINLE